MSDCTNGGRNTYKRPDGFATMHLKAEFDGEGKPWEYQVALNGRKLTAFYIDGVDVIGQIEKLRDVNGELCAEINRQEKRIRELEELVRDIWTAYSTKADESFHPAWEVDEGLADRIAELGIEGSE